MAEASPTCGAPNERTTHPVSARSQISAPMQTMLCSGSFWNRSPICSSASDSARSGVPCIRANAPASGTVSNTDNHAAPAPWAPEDDTAAPAGAAPGTPDAAFQAAFAAAGGVETLAAWALGDPARFYLVHARVHAGARAAPAPARPKVWADVSAVPLPEFARNRGVARACEAVGRELALARASSAHGVAPAAPSYSTAKLAKFAKGPMTSASALASLANLGGPTGRRSVSLRPQNLTPASPPCSLGVWA